MTQPNALTRLNSLGQSIWLDYIDRQILEDGTLAALIKADRLAGLTSNPAIFEKAIAHGGHYADSIARLRAQSVDRETLYQQLVLADISQAADTFRPVYASSKSLDGYVSIEVSPLLARDTEATVAEARKLWKRLDRPNIMIKVPGTSEGLPAIRQLLTDGINVNVTLLFSVGRYLEVLAVYQEALEARLAAGLSLTNVASVASFFLSRIDIKVDARLDALIKQGGERAALARSLRGKAAIASAAFAYRRFREVCAQPRWQTLHTAGARPQRLLWASTSSKDPAFSDIKYVEALIAAETVNTLPLETLNAYRDHGKPELRIEQAIASASEVMHGLASLGIDMKQVDESLELEGIEKFVKPYKSLLTTLETLQSAVGA